MKETEPEDGPGEWLLAERQPDGIFTGRAYLYTQGELYALAQLERGEPLGDGRHDWLYTQGPLIEEDGNGLKRLRSALREWEAQRQGSAE